MFQLLETARLKKDLAQAGWEIESRTYVYLVLSAAFILAVSMGSLALLLGNDNFLSVAVFFLVFGLLFYLGFRLPSFAKQRRALALEAELPSWLRTLGLSLNMGIPFEEALSYSARSSKVLESFISPVLSEVRTGSSVESALKKASSEIDSVSFKRAVAQLVFIYETGAGGEALLKLAEDLSSIECARSRERSSRFSVLGLAFITTACLLPALFLLYTLLSASFMETPVNVLSLWLLFLLGFPAVNALIIAAALLFASSSQSIAFPAFYSQEEKRFFDSVLRERGLGVSFHAVFPFLLAACVVLSAALLFLSGYLALLAYAALLVFLLPFLTYFLLLHLVEQRAKRLEAHLPDALFQAAAFQHGHSMERVFTFIAEADYGPLSTEFEMTANQVRAGVSVPKALAALAARNPSRLLERVASLLSLSYKMGSKLRQALHGTAEDLSSLFAQAREQEAALSLQRYTVLLGGGLVVPALLGWALSFSKGLVSNGVGLAPESSKALLLAASQALPLYLIIFSLLAGVFLALQQGSKARAIVYFLLLAPLSLAVFSVASAGPG